jgi:hypothetical protein
MLMQCEELNLMLGLTDYFREESGGLLRAMRENPEWETVAMSKRVATDAGLDLDTLPSFDITTVGV